MKNEIEMLQEFANQLGYSYIVPVCGQPELSKYFVCMTEAMKNCPHGKFGNPCVITLNNEGETYRLNPDEVVELCRRI